MGAPERKKLIGDLQKERGGRLCLAYVTSTRQNHELQMADDVLRLMFDHLEAGATAAKVGVDLFIHSNGGSGTVPWRVVSLIREYTENFAVLVPHRAFSAATLLALGADDIVMHKMGCLGPIDPSVANMFNPPNPQAPGQPAPISVEDVTAYFKLIQEELGITHSEELIQAVIQLTDKVHPLALGNVQRSHHQARMMARKLLKRHMKNDADETEIVRIIDTLKSNLFFHGHPINRDEAVADLKLKVSKPSAEIESLMWKLYLEYEAALRLAEPFHPNHELEVAQAKPAGALAAAAPLTTQAIVQQMQQLAQNGVGIGPGITEEQFVKLAAAMIPLLGAAPAGKTKVELRGIAGAYLESTTRTDVFKTDLWLERTMTPSAAGPQEVLKQEVIWQRWEKES